MRYDVRFELLLIDYLVSALDGMILFDKDKENFDENFSQLYIAQGFKYTYEEILDKINRLEQFGIIEQTYFDNEKRKWKIELSLDFDLIQLLGIDIVREVVFRTVEKLGPYALSDIETIILHSFNYTVATEVEYSYQDCLNDKSKPYLNIRKSPRNIYDSQGQLLDDDNYINKVADQNLQNELNKINDEATKPKGLDNKQEKMDNLFEKIEQVVNK